MSGRFTPVYGMTKVEDGAVATLTVQSHQNLNSKSEPVDVEFPLFRSDYGMHTEFVPRRRPCMSRWWPRLTILPWRWLAGVR